MGSPAVSGPARVLVLAPNWLGDVVMTTPMFSLLAAAGGDSALELVLGVRPVWADLFRADSRFTGLFPVERNGRHAGVRGLIRLARDLARESFTAVVIGPPSLRMGLATRLAGIPLRVGYKSDGRGPLLTHGLPLPARGSRHYSQEMLTLGHELLRTLGLPLGEPAAQHPALPVPDLPGCTAVLTGEESQGPPLWVLGPGATFGMAKSWPLPPLVEFVGLVRDRGPARIVVLGDAQAGAFAQDLATALDLPSRPQLAGAAGLVDLTGRTDLSRVAAILKSATAFVGNDSGLMHLAGALGVPTIGVFGSSNPAWTAPLGPRAAGIAVTGFACHPCYRKTCNQPQFCLETISAAAVMAKLDSLMDLNAGALD